MSRAQRADRVLRYLMSAADPRLRSETGSDAFGHALAALQAISDGEIQRAVDTTADALTQARDPEALELARAVGALTIAHLADASPPPRLSDPITGGDVLEAARREPGDARSSIGIASTFLLAEAALACARVELASRLLAQRQPPPELFGCADHPFLTFMRIVAVRVATFRGEIVEAERLVQDAVTGASTPSARMLAAATAALVHGNTGARQETQEVIGLLQSGRVRPVDLVTRGCFVLIAYGAWALEDRAAASRLMLEAGGGPGLEHLRIVDRALGLEILASSAATEADATAAAAWLARAMPLEQHPIAQSTVARIRARVALLGDDAPTAAIFAARARENAQTEGRTFEDTQAAILLARARISEHERGHAARGLAEVAHRAQMTGHITAVRAASRELRGIGRRLPPRAASGWAGLSPREREVAALIAEGAVNAEIAAALFVSEHTVRMHVSRVLHAFGVSSRLGVAKALAPKVGNGSPLTARQSEIVALVVEGLGNQLIAERLGIGVSTVEKHVAAVMRRWGVRSRTGIIHIAGGSPGELAG
ncbi:helix-turn-helix transcriptional regulator [Microbacterium schleiferi]|uniref:Helix-turn-helix transcriptional regulator n=1 Tax=Microbacterium schleiferi TaxID=69362 RepID=A0ABU7VAH7_9MICO